MTTEIKDIRIVLLGAGNMATNLGCALRDAKCQVVQVYSRTMASAAGLASMLSCEAVDSLDALNKEADLYIVSLTDNALVELGPTLPSLIPDKLWVHTAGTVGMDIFGESTDRIGVFYPMQSVSKAQVISLHEAPIFVEATQDEDQAFLFTLAKAITCNAYEASSKQRQAMHLAAVFINNFSNQMYACAEHILKENDLPFDIMLPLVDNTAAKVHDLSPVDAQTGPAKRLDYDVMRKQHEMLEHNPIYQDMYKLITEAIIATQSHTEQSNNNEE